VANVPHKALLASCEAIDKVHCHYSNDTKRKDDTENDRDKHESEHFTVLLSGVKILCWFPIISAVVTSYDRQREILPSLPVSGFSISELDILHEQLGCE